MIFERQYTTLDFNYQKTQLLSRQLMSENLPFGTAPDKIQKTQLLSRRLRSEELPFGTAPDNYK